MSRLYYLSIKVKYMVKQVNIKRKIDTINGAQKEDRQTLGDMLTMPGYVFHFWFLALVYKNNNYYW